MTTAIISETVSGSSSSNLELTTSIFNPVVPSRVDNAKYLLADDLIIWSVIDGFLLVVILCGNTLTILAVRYSRRLRSTISNLFILSLAISDLGKLSWNIFCVGLWCGKGKVGNGL